MRSAEPAHITADIVQSPAKTNNISGPAEAWVRRWWAIGGKVRCGRRGLVLIDARHNEIASLPLLGELNSALRDGVRSFVQPPLH